MNNKGDQDNQEDVGNDPEFLRLLQQIDKSHAETVGKDPKLVEATQWVQKQEGRISLPTFRLELNLKSDEAAAIIEQMRVEGTVKEAGKAPFPNFFMKVRTETEGAVPAIPEQAGPAITIPVPAPRPVAPAPMMPTPIVPTPTPKEEPAVVQTPFVVPPHIPAPEPAVFEPVEPVIVSPVFTPSPAPVFVHPGNANSIAPITPSAPIAVIEPVQIPEPIDPDVVLPTLDASGNEWEGNFDDHFTGSGVKKYADGSFDDGRIDNGDFYHGSLKKGRVTFGNGRFMDIDMTEGDIDRGKGRVVLDDGEVQDGEFWDERLYNGTITLPDGSIVKLSEGMEIDESIPIILPLPSLPSYTPSSAATSSPVIDGIREGKDVMVSKELAKNKTAMEGIERVTVLCEKLSADEQRLIGALHITYTDRKPLAQSKWNTLFRTKKSAKPAPWRALDTQVENTILYINPLQLPINDGEITQYIVNVAKKYDNQRKAEMEIDDLETQSGLRKIQLDYDHGNINFFNSLPGIERIKTALMSMTDEELRKLANIEILILMSGQKVEDYRKNKNTIILSCDTTQTEDEIAEYVRDRIKSKPARIAARTRTKIAGALAAVAIIGGGAAAVMHKSAPKPAPTDVAKQPPAPKSPPPASEVPTPELEEPVGKVDMNTIPLGGKVTFKTLEDGVKKGVLIKNSRGKYEPVDAFDFDGDDNRTVVRIQE